MSVKKELKKCPFCGGEAEIYTDGDIYIVFCEKCGVSTIDCASKKVAIEAWNRRV